MSHRVDGVEVGPGGCVRVPLGAVFACIIAFGLGLAALCTMSATPAFAEGGSPSGDEREIAVDLYGQREGYSAVLYDNTNGLPTSEANAIAETSEGFIWIGSYSGLIRYDGNTFERIDSTTGVASVVSLFVDSANRLWVGTNDSGLAVMEKGYFTFFDKDDGLDSLSVRSIAEGPDGVLYVATTDGIVLIDSSMQVTALDDPRISDAYVKDVRAGSDGVIYGITLEGDVFTVEGGVVSSFYRPGDLGITSVISILPDPGRAGYVYLGTENSRVFYGELDDGLADRASVDVSPLSYVKDVERFGDTVLVCADNGAGILEGESLHQLDNIPLDNSIDRVMVDYEGNLWFTSSRQGVMKIVPNQFADIFERYKVAPAVVNATYRYRDLLLVGTDKGLTAIGEEGVVGNVALSACRTAGGTDLGEADLIAMLDGRRIRSILGDSAGRVWLSTYSDFGLVCYDNGSVTCYTSGDGLPTNRVRTTFERSDGAMMVACTGGMALIEDGAVSRVYDESTGIGDADVLTACEAGNGDMVLGTDGGGIFVVRGDDIVRVGVEQGLSSDVVMRVKRDVSRDLFWIVTSNSIAFMDADYRVTTVQNFPYSNNFDLYENAKGDMWVLSSNGIYVIPVEELLANGEISPIYYGSDNGLPVIATANSYSDISEKGDLYIAGTTGVAKVNIEKPFESVSDLKVAVPFVEADGELIFADEDNSLTIPPETSRLTVYPYVFTYSMVNPQVAYRMEGFEHDATTLRRSSLTPIDYTNLRGGDYRFVMQLYDSDGGEVKEYSVSISKPEAPFETVWFRVLLVIALLVVSIVAVWLYFSRKTKKLQEKQREDRLFIREITEAFARTIDMKDHYTNGHSSRVARYTVMLTRELGYDEETVERYYHIGLLHDIGKIGVPGRVLNSTHRLNDEDYELMKSHAELGHQVLKDISIVPELAVGAWSHHERYDGKGYPQGLVGEDIPRVAQIIAVADTFDAMYSNRPYRERMNFEHVVSVIRDGAGTQFAPDVVAAFLRLVERGEFRAADDTGGGSFEDIDHLAP